MSFTFSGTCDDAANWTFKIEVPNGATVTGQQVGAVLVWAAAKYVGGGRIPTVAEEAAMAALCAIPEGWEPTLDGVGTNIILGEGQSHTRTYRNGERVITAPCDASGRSTPETRAALLEAPAPTPEA